MFEAICYMVIGVIFAKAWEKPKKEWVGLTDEELEKVWPFVFRPHELSNKAIYQAIEAKLKEKNT